MSRVVRSRVTARRSAVSAVRAGAASDLDRLVGTTARIRAAVETVIEGKPEVVKLALTVLLTQAAHYRGTAEFVERHGATVWAQPHARWKHRTNPAPTNEIPAGSEAIVYPPEAFVLPQ